MARTPREIPPPLELACLRALWGVGEGNVRTVQEAVAQTRPLAYTTIMTVLDRLVRKGKLTRRKVGRSFVYSPSQSRDALRLVAVRELVDGYFDGSRADLVAFLRGEMAPPAAPVREDRIDTALL